MAGGGGGGRESFLILSSSTNLALRTHRNEISCHLCTTFGEINLTQRLDFVAHSPDNEMTIIRVLIRFKLSSNNNGRLNLKFTFRPPRDLPNFSVARAA